MESQIKIIVSDLIFIKSNKTFTQRIAFNNFKQGFDEIKYSIDNKTIATRETKRMCV